MKPILISGVQPTGKLHIGNYLGALKNFVALQNLPAGKAGSGKYECYFFIADLHSLTEDFSPKEKPRQVANLVLDFLAAGINPQKSTIFIQSQIPAHSELAWILNTIAPMGELSRMTQFKEKSENHKQNINIGLFDYPVLQAADILLYDATVVPVGEDQVQHLEFTRTLARKFNARFGKVFIEPKPLLTDVPRLMSLDNPTKKMSKSRLAGCLFLDDSAKAIREKIKRAVTDSGREVKYDPKHKPAISNLMKIYEAMGEKTIKEIETKFKNKGYGEFKNDLAEVVIKYLAPFQKKKKQLSREHSKIKSILVRGNKKASQKAEKKIKEIKNKIGLTV
ncbi:MAG: tryptophan--tRNA ligase [Patescibacteria group bacterium]